MYFVANMKAHLMAGGVLALTANMEEHILSVIIPPRQTCSTVSRCVLCEWKTTSTSTGRPASLQAFRLARDEGCGRPAGERSQSDVDVNKT